MNNASLFFEHNLSEEKEAREYLKKRGLQDKTIKEWRIGYAFLEWQSLGSHLKSKGFSDIEMEKAGLIKRDGERFYDRFRGGSHFRYSTARVELSRFPEGFFTMMENQRNI